MNFTTYTDYTFEEYRRYNQVMARKVLRLPVVYGVLAAALILLIVLVDDLSIRIGIALGGVIAVPLVIIRRDSILRKTYESGGALMKIRTRFTFYADCVEIASEGGETHGFSHLPYSQIYRILETPTNFYLMIARNQAYDIIRANCSPELDQFLAGLAAQKKQPKNR